MANSRPRKSAPNRAGTSGNQRVTTSGTGSTSRTAATVEEPAELTAEAENSGVSAKKPATKATTAKRPAATKAAASGSAGKRFGDGAAAGGTRKGAPVPKSSGRGGRGGRPAPPVRVGQPKPWGMIAATVAVLLFAGAAIGYAVYRANSTAIPNAPEDIEGVTIATYASQQHVATDQTYDETPPVGGLHDIEWADCDGAIYDQQIRSENAVHSLEHGAVWITYNPDEISDDDLAVLTDYVAAQAYLMLSPFPGLSSLISLQSWNHQVFVDAVDDPRINEFVQLLRQNPATHPEVGASCTNGPFLSDPILEGEQSRSPDPGAVVTGAPPTP